MPVLWPPKLLPTIFPLEKAAPFSLDPEAPEYRGTRVWSYMGRQAAWWESSTALLAETAPSLVSRGPHTATTYLSTAVGVTLVKAGAPGVALDRSVNRESNAFMGSILDGVVNTEGDDAAGVEVAFTLGVGGEKMGEHVKHNPSSIWEPQICVTWSQLKGEQVSKLYKPNFKM